MKKKNIDSASMTYRNPYVEDLETGNVEYTNEELPLVLGVQGLVDTLDQPGEHAVVQGLGQGGHGISHLVDVTALGHVLAADLDLGLEETLQKISGVDAQHEGHLLGLCRWRDDTCHNYYRLVD